jgi:hypothetical protein
MLEDVADPVERIGTLINALVVRTTYIPEVKVREGGRIAAALSREHLRLAEARPQELQNALAPLLAMIGRELASGIEAGAVRPCDPGRVSAFIFNLIAKTLHTELIVAEGDQTLERRERLAQELWDFCRPAIAA